jgi:hypothetical protein
MKPHQSKHILPVFAMDAVVVVVAAVKLFSENPRTHLPLLLLRLLPLPLSLWPQLSSVDRDRA